MTGETPADTELAAELRGIERGTPRRGRWPYAATDAADIPTTDAAGALDEAARVHCQIGAVSPQTLNENRRQDTPTTKRHIAALRRHTRLSDGDIIRLASAAGRLHPSRERHAWEPWPLSALTTAEAEELLELRRTLRYGAAPMPAGENVVILRPRSWRRRLNAPTSPAPRCRCVSERQLAQCKHPNGRARDAARTRPELQTSSKRNTQHDARRAERGRHAGHNCRAGG